MESDMYFFEANIDWTYKSVIGVNTVSSMAASVNDFLAKIKLFYAFADDYTVYLDYEEKYVKGERVI